MNYLHVFTVCCANVGTLCAQCVLHSSNSGYAYARSEIVLTPYSRVHARNKDEPATKTRPEPHVGRDSSIGMATLYCLDGPGIENFPAPVQTGPGTHPASYTMGTGSPPEVKQMGRGVHHPPPPKCRGQERVELYLYSPSGHSWPVLG